MGQTELICKCSHWNWARFGKGLPMEFDTLNFMQRFCRQIACTTMWAANYRNIFNHKQICSLAIATGYMTYLCTFFATNITNER